MASALLFFRSSGHRPGSRLACFFLGCAVLAHASVDIFESAQVAEKDVAASLAKELADVAAGVAAGHRLQALQDSLQSMYHSLPKDVNGLLGHQAVRYALHRHFAHHRGWLIRGLEPGSEPRRPAPVAGGGGGGRVDVKDWVPSFMQGIHEKHLQGRGTDLKELAALAATLEDLVEQEVVARVDATYDAYEVARRSLLSRDKAQRIISAYFVAFHASFNASSEMEAEQKKRGFEETIPRFPEALEWMRDLEAKEFKPSASGVTFKEVSHVASVIGEEYYKFNDLECNDLKSTLKSFGGRKPGRVRLSAFYARGLYTHWQFTETVDYLRSLGALDESDPKQPFVIIANYAMARTNCLDASNLYDICCRNECEDLMGHLERRIGAAAAPPERIASLVATLSSPTVEAPRNLSDALRVRLGEVAASHGGQVPLHGRLFAQWMHHAFPLECPYPHETGSINPQTPDEWIKETGKEHKASSEEMIQHIERDTCAVNHEGNVLCAEETAELPWSMNEELLTSPLRPHNLADRPSDAPAAAAAAARLPALAPGVLAAALAGLAVAAVRRCRGMRAAKEEDDQPVKEAPWHPALLIIPLSLLACATGLLDETAFLLAVVACALVALLARADLPTSWARRLRRAAKDTEKCEV